MDARKTAKRVKPLTKEGFKQWKKHPELYDLLGIDTKGRGI